jgi:hypothetical protein
LIPPSDNLGLLESADEALGNFAVALDIPQFREKPLYDTLAYTGSIRRASLA